MDRLVPPELGCGTRRRRTSSRSASRCRLPRTKRARFARGGYVANGKEPTLPGGIVPSKAIGANIRSPSGTPQTRTGSAADPANDRHLQAILRKPREHFPRAGLTLFVAALRRDMTLITPRRSSASASLQRRDSPRALPTAAAALRPLRLRQAVSQRRSHCPHASAVTSRARSPLQLPANAG